MANPNQTGSNQSGSKQQSQNQNTDRQNQSSAGGSEQGKRPAQGNNPNVKDPSRNTQRKEQKIPSGTDRMNADDSQQDDNQLEIRDDQEDVESQEADETGVRNAGEENPTDDESTPNVGKNRRGNQDRQQTRP